MLCRRPAPRPTTQVVADGAPNSDQPPWFDTVSEQDPAWFTSPQPSRLSVFEGASRFPAELLTSGCVLTLYRWPEMRLIDGDRLAHCARVCSLLWHAPTAGFLIHRRLGLPVALTEALLQELHSLRCLRIAGHGAPEVVEKPVPPPAPLGWTARWRRRFRQRLG